MAIHQRSSFGVKLIIPSLKSNCGASKWCRTLLSSQDPRLTYVCKGFVPGFPQYSSTHAAFVEESQRAISPLVEEYLLSKVAYEFGWTVYPPDAPWNPSRTAAPPLYYASFAGLLYSVKLMLGRGVDVNAQGGYYGNALQAAVAGGHKSVVTLLLESGADPQSRGGKYGYALQAASAKGHEDIANLLLVHGANMNAQGKDQGSALYLASLLGHKRVISLLLDKGADVNAKGGQFGNALQAACLRGEEEVVKLLLEKKASGNAEMETSAVLCKRLPLKDGRRWLSCCSKGMPVRVPTESGRPIKQLEVRRSFPRKGGKPKHRVKFNPICTHARARAHTHTHTHTHKRLLRAGQP